MVPAVLHRTRSSQTRECRADTRIRLADRHSYYGGLVIRMIYQH